MYRALTWLYPRDFRNRYRDDLVQIHADLTRHQGPARAWGRTALDLLVTVPRYRMENLMKESISPTVLTVAIVAMALAGIASVFFTDGYAGAVLLTPLAIVLAVTQRSRLARSMDVVNGSGVRRRRLTIALGLTISLFVIFFTGPLILGDHWGVDAIALFGLWFVLLIAAAVYFVAGVATPRTPATQE